LACVHNPNTERQRQEREGRETEGEERRERRERRRENSKIVTPKKKKYAEQLALIY